MNEQVDHAIYECLSHWSQSFEVVEKEMRCEARASTYWMDALLKLGL